MIRNGQLLDRVASRLSRGLLARSERRGNDVWPEAWNIAAGAVLLGVLVWIAFTTRIPNVERLPAEIVFGFLGLYFYTVGFLSGRRTRQVGTGAWAGVACGLTFGAVVCLEMYLNAMRFGVRESVRAGSLDQVAIAVTGLVFFVMMGAVCGAFGARGAIQPRRQRS